MQSNCNMMVGHSEFTRLLDSCPKEKVLYWKWLCKSFTDENKNIQWCSNLKCGIACERLNETQMLYNVQCNFCETITCFSCGMVNHMPCDCETAEKWDTKNNAESDNMEWLTANTKQCPGCQKHIEKNQGCNHMTCTGGCGHNFCWICMGDWADHGSSTGGYYKCNKYEEAKKDSKFAAAEDMRTRATTDLARYSFHYERYVNHDKSRKLAEKQ